MIEFLVYFLNNLEFNQLAINDDIIIIMIITVIMIIVITVAVIAHFMLTSRSPGNLATTSTVG